MLAIACRVIFVHEQKATGNPSLWTVRNDFYWVKFAFLAGRPDIARYHAIERKREKTIVDLLLGSDGHVYRGRYKMVRNCFMF